jgi:hypothetical protein
LRRQHAQREVRFFEEQAVLFLLDQLVPVFPELFAMRAQLRVLLPVDAPVIRGADRLREPVPSVCATPSQ